MLKVFFIINSICALVIVFLQRRNPATAWAWLLLLIFVPGIGFLIYLMFGQNFHKEKMFREKEIEGEIASAARRQEYKMKEYEGAYDRLIRYNLRANKSIITVNNDIQIYVDGKKKFDALISEIRKAEKYIHMEYYIIREDEIWGKIRDELEKKAKEGIEVRVLFDSIGCRSMKKEDWKRLKKAGIHVAEFFPAVFGKIQPRINYRNHRKIVVIDGRCGFVGGFNIGREYAGEDERFGYWRDTHILIEGGAVTSLAIRFVLDWNFASGENLFLKDHLFEIPEYENKGKVPVQIISSGPDSINPEIRNNYLQIIYMAEESIFIQTPYYIPDDTIKEALKIAAKAGIDVRIMVPNKPDHPFVYWATRSYIGEMLESGVKCYFYEGGFLHAKSVCVDGSVTCLGTANLDIRSFSLNFEVNAVLYSDQVTKELMQEFEKDIENSRQYTRQEYEERGLTERFREQCSRLFSPVL